MRNEREIEPQAISLPADTDRVSATRDLLGLQNGPSARTTRATRRAPVARMSDSELARMRRKVDRGEPLILDLEAGSLITEMMRATAAAKPAATTLNAAVEREQAQAGRELSYQEIQELWIADPGLRAVKQLHDRERARWRRANGILRESNLLLRGETIAVAGPAAVTAASAEPLVPDAAADLDTDFAAPPFEPAPAPELELEADPGAFEDDHPYDDYEDDPVLTADVHTADPAAASRRGLLGRLRRI